MFHVPLSYQPLTPFIVEIVDEPTKQTTAFDVLIGAVEIVIAIVVVALLLGLLCAGVLIALRRIRGLDIPDDGSSDGIRLRLEPPPRKTTNSAS